jgi:hypothetical protein
VSVDVRQLFEQHKKSLAIGGAAVVGGLALLQARKKGDPAAAPAGFGPGAAAGSMLPTSGGRTSGTYAVANTSATDAYNAMQPQFEALQRQVERQSQNAIPVPKPPADGIYRNSLTGGIYQVTQGFRDALTPQEWHALGWPQFIETPNDSPVWKSTTLSGTENE